MSREAVAWKIRSVLEMHWREWGEDSVVFEARSGQIFQFDALSSAVIGCLEAKPLTTSEVCATLAQDLEGSPADELDTAIVQIVNDFHRLGWLEPIMIR